MHDQLLVEDILSRCDREMELLNEWFPHADIHVEEIQGQLENGLDCALLGVHKCLYLTWRRIQRHDRQEVAVSIVDHDEFEALRDEDQLIDASLRVRPGRDRRRIFWRLGRSALTCSIWRLRSPKGGALLLNLPVGAIVN